MITEQGIAMTSRQQIFALVMSIALLLVIIELVRRRKLREEYSWIWILTAFVILVLSVWYDGLSFITRLIGAVSPVSTLFVFGIFFLVLTNIYLSIRLSTLTTQAKNLAQKLAILDLYLRESRQERRNLEDGADTLNIEMDCSKQIQCDLD